MGTSLSSKGAAFRGVAVIGMVRDPGCHTKLGFAAWCLGVHRQARLPPPPPCSAESIWKPLRSGLASKGAQPEHSLACARQAGGCCHLLGWV